MIHYTAEDFANARFAEHPDGPDSRLAMRALDLDYHPWSVSEPYAHVARSDNDLASTGWRPVREAAPLTLDTLREAWENADRLGGCKPGDTLIERLDPDVDAFTTYRADYSANAQALPDTIRVAGRAPEPEPWQALADVIEEAKWEIDRSDPAALARWVYERGVRVVGGDDA